MDENKTYGTRSARLWKLFLSTLYISSFTFGGGHHCRCSIRRGAGSGPVGKRWGKMIYLQLFLSFLQVGMFSVGGGYAAMPLIQS